MPFVAHVVVSVVAASLGIVFNGYILFVLLWHKRIRTANNVLLLHLAFVDTLYCILVLAYSTALGPATPENGVCAGHGFLSTLLPTILVWTVCGLSCDRYAAISQPLQYSSFVNTRRALGFVILVWLFGIAISLPPLVGTCHYSFQDERWACTARCSRDAGDVGYVMLSIGLAIFFPVAIILSCNLHMWLIARYHRHRIVSAIYEVTLRAQATVTHQRNPCYLAKFRGRNAVATIAQHVGSLVVFTIPYFAVLLWEATTGQAGNSTCVSVTTVLLTCTPPLNAYVYGVKSRVLRQTLKRLLQRHFYKKEASREVERRLSLVSTRTHRTSVCRRLSAPLSSLGPSERSSWFDFRQGSRRPSASICGERMSHSDKEDKGCNGCMATAEAKGAASCIQTSGDHSSAQLGR